MYASGWMDGWMDEEIDRGMKGGMERRSGEGYTKTCMEGRTEGEDREGRMEGGML